MSEGVPPRPMTEPNVAAGTCCCARIALGRQTKRIAVSTTDVRETSFTDLYSWSSEPTSILPLNPCVGKKSPTQAQHRGRESCYNRDLHIRVSNRDRGTIVAEAADVADSSAKRRTGLLKHDKLEPGSGLWIA